MLGLLGNKQRFQIRSAVQHYGLFAIAKPLVKNAVSLVS